MRNGYLNDIRKHIDQILQIGSTANFNIWDIKEDEVNDPSLVSLRLYNTRMHADVVMVACGVNGIFEPLPMKRIALPKISQIVAYRKKWSITD